MILAIETATDVCSVAFQNDEEDIFEKRTDKKGVHSEKLFGFIRELMSEHHFELKDLEAVLLSNGPGSYTGLRIAGSAVKGMLFGSDIKVFAYNTLAGIAKGVIDRREEKKEVRIHAVLNARRKHVYHQLFYGPGLKRESDADIIEIRELLGNIRINDLIGGTGIFRFAGDITENVRTFGMEVISAINLIRLHQSQEGREHCRQVGIKSFKSEYITSSQVNNTGL